MTIEAREIYVGKTEDFEERERNHKSASKTSNYKLYQYIRAYGGWSNFKMLTITQKECIDDIEAGYIERLMIDEMKASLNTQKPGRTKKEWRVDNREIINEKGKQYYQDNIEQISERRNNTIKIIENKSVNAKSNTVKRT